MKKVLIINGYAGCGKTQFEEYIAKNTNSMIYSSITPAKDIAAKYYGWNGEKTEEWREFLAKTKRMLVEKFDYIFLDVSKKIREFYSNVNYDILMIDSREPDEIDRFKRCYRAKTIFIVNDNIEKITSNDADANVENYEYDCYIDNNGTLEELEQTAIEFINKLKSEDK